MIKSHGENGLFVLGFDLKYLCDVVHTKGAKCKKYF
jgi:hypothetical protein